MKYVLDTQDIFQFRRMLAVLLPIFAPSIVALNGYLVGGQDGRWALAHGLMGSFAALWTLVLNSPFQVVRPGRITDPPYPPASPPEPLEPDLIPPEIKEEKKPDLPKAPGAAILLIALASALAVVLEASPGLAAETSPSARTSTSAYPRLELTLNANAAALHLDGSFGIGPALCLGWRGPVIFPIGCLSIEVARGPDGAFSGRLGPELGFALPGLQDLGLKTTPSLVFGWLLLRIGPGDFFDRSKGAYVISGSFPFLGF